MMSIFFYICIASIIVCSVTSLIVTRRSYNNLLKPSFDSTSMDTMLDDMFKVMNDIDKWYPASAISTSFIPTTTGNALAKASSIPIDIKETKDVYELLCDLPGIEKKDISLTINENILTIAANRKLAQENDENAGISYQRTERFSGTYTRSLILPDNSNPEQITAESKDGQLTVIIPKLEKQPLSIKTIEIK